MTFDSLEQNARRAKEANSFWEYKPGSATEEYREYCQNADEIAQRAKERLEKSGAPAERSEKVDYLLNLYKSKKSAWLNEMYSVRARVPSVMIAGPANYPTRQKEKQLARERTLQEQDPESILDEIKGIGYNAKTIYSDDKNAVERIKEKIESLKNAPDPYGNKSAEIRRLKERLLSLAPEEFAEQQSHITVNGVKTFDEIVSIWANGRLYKSDFVSQYDPAPHWYFDLSIDFYDGKRHYRELLNIEVDEAGENHMGYDWREKKKVSLPLTDKYKYRLIISKISGSGNKAVIYQYLKGLIPQTVSVENSTDKPKTDTVTVNGETAQVIRNKECMRLQLVFEGKPSDETRNKLKSNGFKWAPSSMAWQRLLNENAEWALRRLA